MNPQGRLLLYILDRSKVTNIRALGHDQPRCLKIGGFFGRCVSGEAQLSGATTHRSCHVISPPVFISSLTNHFGDRPLGQKGDFDESRLPLCPCVVNCMPTGLPAPWSHVSSNLVAWSHMSLSRCISSSSTGQVLLAISFAGSLQETFASLGRRPIFRTLGPVAMSISMLICPSVRWICNRIRTCRSTSCAQNSPSTILRFLLV